METQIIGIPLTFLVLFAVVLWFIILGKGKWWLKAAIVPVVLYFSLIIWFSLSQISGWASPNDMPNTFILHWSIIKEPSKKDSHDQGAIFIWATEVDDNYQMTNQPVNPILYPFTPRKNAAEPRSYRVPYSHDLHEKLAKLQTMVARGKTVIGKRNGNGLTTDEEGQGNGKEGKGKQGKGGAGGKEGGKQGSGGSLSRQQDFMFYELPAPKLPEKITNPSDAN